MTATTKKTAVVAVVVVVPATLRFLHHRLWLVEQLLSYDFSELYVLRTVAASHYHVPLGAIRPAAFLSVEHEEFDQ